MKVKAAKEFFKFFVAKCRGTPHGTPRSTRVTVPIGAAFCLLLSLMPTLSAAQLQYLKGHVPDAVAAARSNGLLPATNYLRLAIGLPLRNQTELTNLLAQIYNPGSTNYHHFLTSAQFTERFGPTTGDYQSVQAYASANGLQVTGTHANRTLLDVAGSVSQIEQAFHVHLRLYPHPREARNFYAPDTEPSLNLSVPILHISGLDNFIVPHPMNLRETPQAYRSSLDVTNGSGPDGSYWGNDFRNAYVPGTVMTGLGQQVALLQLDSGFYQSDITSYENQANLPNVPVTPVLLDGYGGGPGFANDECSLDIEMAISMAPGLSQILVYEGTVADDILNQMATDDSAQQLSSSYAFAVDPSTEQTFQQFAAQGQSFFNASGDGNAWVGGVVPPSDDPNITIVGGTTLTICTNGAWLSEKVWRWNDTNGSGGGISTTYSIPYWQQGVDMTENQGSTSMRNIPDVALTADNVYVIFGNGTNNVFGGTSCASPLWAGFAALMNQQAANNNVSPVGFVNPTIYNLGQAAGYTNLFHDITVGNNTNDLSDDLFFAVPGYDLCTGWGTPAGQSLIDAMVGPASPTPVYIITQPQSQTVMAGANVTFSVLPGGLPPFSYQWTLNNTNLAGATNELLTLDDVQTNQASNYEVLVTNEFGSAYSSTAVLTVNQPLPCDPAPSGLVSWWAAEGNANDTMGLNNGTVIGNLSYAPGEVGQAFVFDGSTSYISVPASPSLDIGATGTGITLECWIAPSAFVVNVYGAPIIEWDSSTIDGLQLWCGGNLNANVKDTSGNAHTIQTANGILTANEWQHVALTYDENSGNSYIYLNGNVVASQNLGSFVPQTTYPLNIGRRTGQPIGDGDTYGGLMDEVSIYNRALGSNEIQAIYLAGSGGKCETPPIIVTQPTNETAIVGNSAVFSVNATGPNPSYQWTFQGVDLAGATNETLVLNDVQLNEAGVYEVLVTNAFGSTLSSNAVLTVSPPLGCAPFPFGMAGWWEAEGNANDTLGLNNGTAMGNLGFAPGEVGQAFVFDGSTSYITVPASTNLDIGANGSGITIECWIQPSAFNIATGAPLIEWDSSSTDGLQLWTGGNMNGNVKDIHGTAHTIQTASGLLSTNNWQHVAMTYDKITGNAFIYLNGTVMASQNFGNVVPQTTYPANIGRRTGQPIGLGDTYAGLMDELSIYNRALSSNEIQAIYLAGSNGKCFTSPVIAAQPTNETVTLGNTATFSVIADGSTNFNYQWNFQGAGLAGATNATLVLTNVQFSQAGAYSVLVTNAFGSAPSTNALLTVAGLPPVVMTQPTNLTVVLGSSAAFNVTAAGTAPLYCQWFFNTTNKLTGATNATLTVTNSQATQAGKYFVLITNLYGQAQSSNALLSFFVPPAITIQPTNLNVKVGTTAAFAVVATGSTNLAYQWYWNTNNLIAKATNSTLILASVQTTNAGTYSVLVTNMAGSALSSNALLVIHLQDHFAWAPVPSPRFVNVPFAVSIQAQNVTNGIVTNFTGTVSLTSTVGIPVQPSTSGPFVRGSWTGTVSVRQLANNLVLEANDGLGDTGLANPINIVAPPALNSLLDHNFLLLFWPTNIPGFMVQTSPKLNSTNWVPVNSGTFGFGNSNLNIMSLTGTNAFFRLWYTNP